MKSLPPDHEAAPYDATLTALKREFDRTVLEDQALTVFTRLALDAQDQENANDELMKHIESEHTGLKAALQRYIAAEDLLQNAQREQKLGYEDAQLRALEQQRNEAYDTLHDRTERFICAVRDDIGAADTIYNAFIGYKSQLSRGYMAIRGQGVPVQDEMKLSSTAKAKRSVDNAKLATKNLKNQLQRKPIERVQKATFSRISTVLEDLQGSVERRKRQITEWSKTLELLPDIEDELDRLESMPVTQRLGMPGFQDYLRTGEAWENAVFLLDIEQAERPNLWIYETYVKTHAPREINISSGDRSTYETEFNQLKAEAEDVNHPNSQNARMLLSNQDRRIFDAAIKEILRLLNSRWTAFRGAKGKAAVVNNLITRRR